jgi:hypothetical protein
VTLPSGPIWSHASSIGALPGCRKFNTGRPGEFRDQRERDEMQLALPN